MSSKFPTKIAKVKMLLYRRKCGKMVSSSPDIEESFKEQIDVSFNIYEYEIKSFLMYFELAIRL